MTALQIIHEIEAAGGVLTLNGDRIRYDVPMGARALVDVLRQHRDEVLQALRGRKEAARQQVACWFDARCAHSRRVWSSEKFLYRDYATWCQMSKQTPSSRELFCAIMDEIFQRDVDGWQGLCLAVDSIQ